MRFIDRMARLVRADAHGLVDQLEERTLLMKQHLREAELEVVHKRARLEGLEDEERRLGDELERVEGEASALDADLRLALEGGEEKLARFAARRLIPKREALAALRARRDELVRDRAGLAERLEAQERELAGLQSRVRLRLAAARAETASPEWASRGVAEEEVDLELLRRRRGASPGEAR